MHTPGPWFIAGDTFVYALMNDGFRRGQEVFKNRFSAQVQKAPECSEEEAEANARLIAAAPDLLEALKMADELAKALEEMKEQIEQAGQTHCLGSCYEAANRLLKAWWNTSGAAIKKAEGK